MKRLDADFISHGARCAAWLYLPEGVEPPPLVIMAHGFAAERSFRLPAYAERFAARGLAVLLFDYRNFGASEGEPRQLVSPRRHVQDWRAALAHARTLERVDPGRIALWGTSFSGGHVLVAAAGDRAVRAVVAQVPFVDGLAVGQGQPVKFMLAGLGHGLLDLARLAAGLSPHYVPVIAEPSEFGLMNTPECMPGYRALVPPDSNWPNRAPGRIALAIPFYRPVRYAGRIQCPVLIVYAERDSLIPYRAVERCAAKIRTVETMKLPLGHFDVYLGEAFERVSTRQADFLVQHLRK